MDPQVSRRLAWAMNVDPQNSDQRFKFVDAAENAPSFAALDKNVKDYILAAEKKHGTNPAHSLIATKSATADVPKFVPGPAEVERAKSRLAILPNPNDPRIDNPDKWVESPWRLIEVPTVNPASWDLAKPSIINLDELLATDPFLERKRVKKHIDAMGQALTANRSYPLVVDVDGHKIIIDGHHRLMASWLLGQDQAAVWLV